MFCFFKKAIFESLALCLISSLYTFQRLESCVLYLLYGQLLKHIFSSAAGHFWPLFDRMKITSETQLNYHRQFYKKIWQVYIYCGGSFLSIHIGEKKFTCGLESKYFWAKKISFENLLKRFEKLEVGTLDTIETKNYVHI